MPRWLYFIALLAGCDLVFTIDEPKVIPSESTTNDEDGDGRVDAADLCPHVRDDLGIDRDGDAIGDDCDPDPAREHDRYFFAFAEPRDLERVTTLGRVEADPAVSSAVRIGKIDLDRSGLILDVDAAEARIEVDGDLVEFDSTLGSSEFTELELHAVHRAFETDRTLRGDRCVTGRTPGNSPPNYLERHEDDRQLDSTEFSGAFQATPFFAVLDRTTDSLRCSFRLDGALHASPNVSGTAPRSGKVVVTTENLELRVRWMWIVIPRP